MRYSSKVNSLACSLRPLLLLWPAPLDGLLLLPPLLLAGLRDCTAATTNSFGANPQKRTSESATNTMNTACHTCVRGNHKHWVNVNLEARTNCPTGVLTGALHRRSTVAAMPAGLTIVWATTVSTQCHSAAAATRTVCPGSWLSNSVMLRHITASHREGWHRWLQ